MTLNNNTLLFECYSNGNSELHRNASEYPLTCVCGWESHLSFKVRFGGRIGISCFLWVSHQLWLESNGNYTRHNFNISRGSPVQGPLTLCQSIVLRMICSVFKLKDRYCIPRIQYGWRSYRQGHHPRISARKSFQSRNTELFKSKVIRHTHNSDNCPVVQTPSPFSQPNSMKIVYNNILIKQWQLTVIWIWFVTTFDNLPIRGRPQLSPGINYRCSSGSTAAPPSTIHHPHVIRSKSECTNERRPGRHTTIQTIPVSCCLPVSLLQLCDQAMFVWGLQKQPGKLT